MPINQKLYGKDWKDIIRPDILKRDKYRCSKCGAFRNSHGFHDSANNWHAVLSDIPAGSYIKGHKVVICILQVCHLDNNVQNMEYKNLITFCQACHNRNDMRFRIQNRIINRKGHA